LPAGTRQSRSLFYWPWASSQVWSYQGCAASLLCCAARAPNIVLLSGLFPICGLEIFVGQVCLRMLGSIEPSFVEPAQTMWLNIAIMCALNLIMLPVELLLITPFTTLGAKVMHASVLDITSKMWVLELRRHPVEMKIAMMHSVLGWAILSPFLVAGGKAHPLLHARWTCASIPLDQFHWRCSSLVHSFEWDDFGDMRRSVSSFDDASAHFDAKGIQISQGLKVFVSRPPVESRAHASPETGRGARLQRCNVFRMRHVRAGGLDRGSGGHVEGAARVPARKTSWLPCRKPASFPGGFLPAPRIV
jgi:hypothetical protein